MDGVDVVYYLVHSIGTGGHFEDADRRAGEHRRRPRPSGGHRAHRLPRWARAGAGERRPPHLASRAEVGQIFLDWRGPRRGAAGRRDHRQRLGLVRDAALPDRAASGDGHAPKWVRSRVQPIAVRDVLAYLVGALDLSDGTNRRFDIAGPDVLTYREMMQRYAAVAGLRTRLIIPVPVLDPWLSSQWVNVVTPVPKAIARPADRVAAQRGRGPRARHRDAAPDRPPRVRRGGAPGAARRSATRDVETRWSGAEWPGAPSDPMPTDPDWSGGHRLPRRAVAPVDASVDHCGGPVEGIGGDRGWYSFPLAWAVRGLLDRLVGGVGLRRGPARPRPAGRRRRRRLLAGGGDRATDACCGSAPR